jgi:type I restriction enzyme S subunit
VEVKPGFKLTEVGVIPEEWEVASLGECISDLRSGVSVNSVQEAAITSFDGPTILKTSCVARGQYVAAERKRVAAEDVSRAKLNPVRDTILISRMNTPELVGECGYVEETDPNVFLPDRLWMTSHRGVRVIDVRWLNCVLSSKEYRRRIKEVATGTSGSMKNISKESFLSLLVAYPLLSEQHAIAEVITEAENAARAIDRLIAKKRDLKQAAIQQLLTGKTRLPGFHGEWEVKRLAEFGHWRGGITPSMAEVSFWQGGDFPWASSGDVKVPQLNHTNSRITARAVDSGAAVVVPAGSLLVVMRSGILRKHLPVAIAGRDLAINQDIKALVPRPEYSSDFLLHLLTWNGKRILESCMKSGTTVESIELSWLKSFTVLVPQLEEQVRISAVLSDLDAELSALETRRDKTRALKEAMMQALLTGRTRLV